MTGLRVVDRAADIFAGFLLAVIAIIADLVAPPELVAGGWAVVLVLQVAAGLAIIHLVRCLGGGRAGGLGAAALGAAILYAAVALRHEAPAAAGLAIMLAGIERARWHDVAKSRGGWLPIAAGMVLLCARGWNEAAMTGAALAGLIVLLRLTLAADGWDGALFRRVVRGVGVGLLLAAPLLLLRPARAPQTVPTGSSHLVWVGALTMAAALLAVVPARRSRALRWLLFAWVALWAGRLVGWPAASFLLDIVTPMPDGVFINGARAAVILALCVLAALTARERPLIGAVAACMAFAAALSITSLAVVPTFYPSALEHVDNAAGPNAAPLALQPGQSLGGEFPAGRVPDRDIAQAGLALGTYRGQASGELEVMVCSGPRCSTGRLDIGRALDNEIAFATLDARLRPTPGMPIRWQARHVGGHGAVAIWLAKAPGATDLVGPAGMIPDAEARVGLAFPLREDEGSRQILPAWAAWGCVAVGAALIFVSVRSVDRAVPSDAP